MADGNSSSSVAIVAIVVLVLAAGMFLFTHIGRSGDGPAKNVTVDLNVPKPQAPQAPGS